MKLVSRDYYQVEGQRFFDYTVARMFANILSLATQERIAVTEIDSGQEMAVFEPRG